MDIPVFCMVKVVAVWRERAGVTIKLACVVPSPKDRRRPSYQERSGCVGAVQSHSRKPEAASSNETVIVSSDEAIVAATDKPVVASAHETMPGLSRRRTKGPHGSKNCTQNK